jgi:Flp pilus assembly protein TadD
METTAMAIGKAYALDPTSDQIANNQAAVLIATETQRDEAMKLTMRLLAKQPRSVDLNINHSLALINIGRIDDAESIVRRISPVGLRPEEKSVLNLAWFRIHESRTNAPLALRAAAEIDRSHLMPPQVDRLELGLKRLAP